MKTINDEDLINKYLDNNLSEDEVVEFDRRYLSDDIFRKMANDFFEIDKFLLKIEMEHRERSKKNFLAECNCSIQ